MIKAIRMAKGLTQQQVAEAVGVARSTVAKWETGVAMPRAGTLRKMSESLGCTADELLRSDVFEKKGDKTFGDAV